MSENPREHARYSPSTLKHRGLCPRWESTGESGPAAQEGEMLHARTDSGDLSGLDDEQSTAVSLVRNLYRDLGNEMPDAVEQKEVRVEVTGVTFGYLDRLWVDHGTGTAVIADAKFGRNRVDPAESNLQGWAYAVGVWDTHPDVQRIDVVFAMPRLDIVTEHTFSRTLDYARMKSAVEAIVRRCEDPASMPVASEAACQYCGNKGSCPAALAAIGGVAADYSGLPVPREVHSSAIVDPADMASALRLAPIAEDWARSVRRHALAMRLAGTEIPGFRLAEKKGNPRISCPAGALEIAKRHGLDDHDFAGCCEVSATKLKDAAAEKAPRGEKGRAKQSLEDELAENGVLERGSAIQYLAREKQEETKQKGK